MNSISSSDDDAGYGVDEEESCNQTTTAQTQDSEMNEIERQTEE